MARRIVELLRNPLAIAGLAIVALLVAGELLSPGFASQRQIITLLKVAALLGIVAAGQNLVILGGREGIDLSVGGIISFSAFLAGNLMQQQDAHLVQGVTLVLAAAFAIGFVTGLGVTLLRIPPLVMTLGMLGVVQGGLVLLTRGVPSGRAAPMLGRMVGEPLVFGLPGILFIWILIGAALTLVLRRTTFGYNVYAIGTNEAAAALAGVPVRRTRTLLFALSGLFAGMTGILLLGYTNYVFVGAGDQYMLPSIIAVVIGGTSLAGGSGGYVGTMAGAVVLVLLQSILTTLNIPPFGRQIVFGATLLALMLLYGRQRRLRG
ncbi:ABC transporter permease [Piscinibacter sp.]|jgi:ribose transport system permease protein|uniref:ABC transporter permease n=1 Tax=Piscinibacter sp. TaxID=1903157 RepID=UPI0035593CF2